MQQLQLMTESLKSLIAEASNHQSQMDRLEGEISEIKQNYESLKDAVSNLGIKTTEECEVVPEPLGGEEEEEEEEKGQFNHGKF